MHWDHELIFLGRARLRRALIFVAPRGFQDSTESRPTLPLDHKPSQSERASQQRAADVSSTLRSSSATEYGAAESTFFCRQDAGSTLKFMGSVVMVFAVVLAVFSDCARAEESFAKLTDRLSTFASSSSPAHPDTPLLLHSLAPRGTSGARVGERGNPIKPSSSPRPSPPPLSEEREKTASISDADFLTSMAVNLGSLPRFVFSVAQISNLSVSVKIVASRADFRDITGARRLRRFSA